MSRSEFVPPPEPTPPADEPLEAIMPADWTMVNGVPEVPDELFIQSKSLEPGKTFSWHGSMYKMWSVPYDGQIATVPVPVDFSFLNAEQNIVKAATIMAEQQAHWKASAPTLLPYGPHVLDEGDGHWHIEPGLIEKFLHENLHVNDDFSYKGVLYTVTHHHGVHFPMLKGINFLTPGINTMVDKMIAAVQQAKNKKPTEPAHLLISMYKHAILYALQQGKKPGDTWVMDGQTWFWSSISDHILPNNAKAWDASPNQQFEWAKQAMKAWGSVLHPDPQFADALSKIDYDDPQELGPWDHLNQDTLTDEMIEAVYQFVIDKKIPSQDTFILFGHQWWNSKQYGPIPNQFDTFTDESSHYDHGSWDWWKKHWKKWNKKVEYNLNAITVSPNVVFNWTANGNMNATAVITAPPFPGKKSFPKWGPATANFETALEAALKKRLGPYATDSMVKAVTLDMLPVLHTYWTEVNEALVALKMTAAEQNKDVPKQMPGWVVPKPDYGLLEPEPTVKKVPDAALHGIPAKEKSTAALWQAALSPYLKKTYTHRIEFGIACGALEDGTTLSTPYIDLWLMFVTKFTKKGEPPMAEDYIKATQEWEKTLEEAA